MSNSPVYQALVDENLTNAKAHAARDRMQQPIRFFTVVLVDDLGLMSDWVVNERSVEEACQTAKGQALSAYGREHKAVRCYAGWHNNLCS